MIYRIDADQAGGQAAVFVLGLALLVLTVIFLRDIHALERYRYTIAAGGIALLLLPRVPGIGEQVNGAYLGIGLGPAVLPARGVRQVGDHHLPRQLPPRHRGRAAGRPARKQAWWVPWAAAGVAFLIGWFLLGVGMAVTVPSCAVRRFG